MSTVDITLETFESTIKDTEKPIVLIDAWAAWCGPCRMFAPVYDAASEQHDDIVFAKIDTEAQPELAAGLQIQSIPTLMAFRDGIMVFRQAGAMPAPALEQIIQGVKGLDMEMVRREVEAQQDGAAPTS